MIVNWGQVHIFAPIFVRTYLDALLCNEQTPVSVGAAIRAKAKCRGRGNLLDLGIICGAKLGFLS